MRSITRTKPTRRLQHPGNVISLQHIARPIVLLLRHSTWPAWGNCHLSLRSQDSRAGKGDPAPR